MGLLDRALNFSDTGMRKIIVRNYQEESRSLWLGFSQATGLGALDDFIFTVHDTALLRSIWKATGGRRSKAERYWKALPSEQRLSCSRECFGVLYAWLRDTDPIRQIDRWKLLPLPEWESLVMDKRVADAPSNF